MVWEAGTERNPPTRFHRLLGAVSLRRRLAGEGGMGPLGVVEADPLADDPFGPEAVGQLVQVKVPSQVIGVDS